MNFSNFINAVIFSILLSTNAALAEESAAWAVRPWTKSLSVPKGAYKGPGEDIHITNKAEAKFLAGCSVENARFYVENSGKLNFSDGLLRNTWVGLALWGRLDAARCAFENCRMEKIERYYGLTSSSTKWRFDNCVFGGVFIKDDLLIMDFSVRAEKCTFLDLKTPKLHYRNNPSDEAQQDWLKFENCRFERCEIEESFLLCTVGCEFDSCKFIGQKDWKLSKPITVNAYIVGTSALPKSYEKPNLKVKFSIAHPPQKCGTTLAYSYTNKKFSLPTISIAAVPVVLGATKVEPTPTAPSVAKAPTGDGPPQKMTQATVTGTSGAAAIPLKRNTSAVNALVVVDLGQAQAGAASKLTALALPVEGGKVADVGFNQPVGETMAKSLAEVAKHLQLRHKGWPRDHHIEISFADKWSPKNGPSAALACGLLLDALFDGNELDPAFSVTGDINADGSVRPVGGIAGKVRGAVAAKCQRVGVPAKNEPAVADLLLTDEIGNLAAIEIYGLDTFDQARELATFPLKSSTELASNSFLKLRAIIQPGGKFSADALANPAATSILREILANAPNHLSAKFLLMRASGKTPPTLSLGGSFQLVDEHATALFRATSIATNGDALRKLAREDVANSVSKMRGVRERVDARVRPTVDALLLFGQAVKDFQSQPPPKKDAKGAKMFEDLSQAAAAVNATWAKLQADRTVVEELVR
jgi:hypothetical protein